MARGIETGQNPEILQKDSKLNSPISRRRFLLKTLGVGLTLAMISEACSAPAGAQSPAPKPSESSSPFPSPTLVASGETPSQTPEASPKLTEITSDTFTKAFSRLNGDSEIVISQNGKKITKSVDELSSITSSNWNEQTTSATISRNPIKALEFALSSAELSQQTGTIDMSKMFPELDLKVSRFSLNNLPNDKNTEATINLQPQNLTLRKGMGMTILGIDASNKNAVVAFSDNVRQTDNISTMYLGILPFETKSQEEGATSFQEILSKNGASYDPKSQSILYETGETLPLHQIGSSFLQDIKTETGSYFIDIDPLKKNKDGTSALTHYPIVVALPANLSTDKIIQLKDGRTAVIDAGGNTVARARFFFNEDRFNWATDKESLQDFTIRELADAAGLKIACFGDINYLSNPEFINSIESSANKFFIDDALKQNIVFEKFTDTDWNRMLSDWNNVQKSFADGLLPEGYNYNFRLADIEIAFAKKLGMKIKAPALLAAGDDSPTSVIQGGFSNSELLKIQEFMVKSTILKYKNAINEWGGASEVVTVNLFGSDIQKFWYIKFGTEIVDKVFTWANEVHPNAKLTITEDHILDGDALPEVVQGYINLLSHFKANEVPVAAATIENNMWIYTPPNKSHMIQILKQIKALGYKIGPAETAVMISDQDFSDPSRPKLVRVTDKQQAQAKVYQDVLEAYLEVGAEFGLGGISDKISWFNQVGQSDTEAMIFDQDWQPKPAYFALVNVLKSYLKSIS